MAGRGAAAVMAVVASAGTGVVTNVATSGASWSWWLALLVLVVVGAASRSTWADRPGQTGRAGRQRWAPDPSQ